MLKWADEALVCVGAVVLGDALGDAAGADVDDDAAGAAVVPEESEGAVVLDEALGDAAGADVDDAAAGAAVVPEDAVGIGVVVMLGATVVGLGVAVSMVGLRDEFESCEENATLSRNVESEGSQQHADAGGVPHADD